MTLTLERVALPFDDPRYMAVKDPCPVLLDSTWHLFGTGITGPYTYELLHATATQLQGPWQMGAPVEVHTVQGHCVGAPGVVVDDNDQLHMFLQTDYNRLGGRIEHMVSNDAGVTFEHARTALSSLATHGEAGIYDPHPAVIGGHPYLVYSAFTTVGQPDVHVARSETGTWEGPWERLGPILRHEDVGCHNQRGAEDYEWGLEGAQLIELTAGAILLNAVCFVADAPRGRRQRVFFATAGDPMGPYAVHGPVISLPGGHAAGENGHGTVVLDGCDFALFFQERDVDDHWRYALAVAPLDEVIAAGEEAQHAA